MYCRLYSRGLQYSLEFSPTAPKSGKEYWRGATSELNLSLKFSESHLRANLNTDNSKVKGKLQGNYLMEALKTVQYIAEWLWCQKDRRQSCMRTPVQCAQNVSQKMWRGGARICGATTSARQESNSATHLIQLTNKCCSVAEKMWHSSSGTYTKCGAAALEYAQNVAP